MLRPRTRLRAADDEHRMFEAWGRRVYAWRKATMVVSTIVLIASALMLIHGARLVSGAIHGTEADTGAQLVNRELRNAEGAGFTLIFSSNTLSTDDDAFRRAVLAAVAPLRQNPYVESVTTPFDPNVSMFLASSLVSVDSHHALALVVLHDRALTNTRIYPRLRSLVRAPGLDVAATGIAAFRSDLDRTLEVDLIRAEILSTPFTILVLLLVFGSLAAALLPVGVGGLAVACGVAAVMVLARVTEIAQYAINVVSLVGLGVAIDYSLFIVSRYRDELEGGASVEDAIATSVATSGRAVAFSGLAVAIGLSGLLFFRGSYLASLGMGGTVVVALAVLFALTFLPALLGMLGKKVMWGRLRIPGSSKLNEGFWRLVAKAVMRRPVLILLPTLALLLAASHPFFKIRVATPDVNVLPAHAPARQGDALLRETFPERTATRVAVVVRFPGYPLANTRRADAIFDLSRQLARIPGVDHVESIVDLDETMDRDAYAQALVVPRDQLPEALAVVANQTVGRTILVISLVTEAEPASEAARAIVRAARHYRHVADGETFVTGPTAIDVDSATYLRAHTPQAIVFVVIMTILVLFFLLGSVVLPLKAVLMNFLSITGSFGALVWIFQDGHLHRLLRFTPGPIEPSVPIVMFCAVFGLSMDYEVLLLTRMQEEYERSRDNAKAVVEGLERSGRLITSAAAIMVVVFAAFVTTEIVLLKAVGLGMAIAVALDATVVRLLVVPATMRLFGDLNWWAPRFLARFQQKFRPSRPH